MTVRTAITAFLRETGRIPAPKLPTDAPSSRASATPAGSQPPDPAAFPPLDAWGGTELAMNAGRDPADIARQFEGQ